MGVGNLRLQLRVVLLDLMGSGYSFQGGRGLWGQCRPAKGGTWGVLFSKKKRSGFRADELQKGRRKRKRWILPRNGFVVFYYMIFRPQWRDHGGSLCSSGLDTVAVCLSTGHFEVVLIHGAVQKPIGIGGRDQVDGLIFQAVQRRR